MTDVIEARISDYSGYGIVPSQCEYLVEYKQHWWCPATHTYPLSTLSEEEWMAERLSHSVRLMKDSVDISTHIRSGVPVLRNTRLPLSRILAEIAHSDFVGEFAESWEIDANHLRDFLDGLSIQLDRPFVR